MSVLFAFMFLTFEKIFGHRTYGGKSGAGKGMQSGKLFFLANCPEDWKPLKCFQFLTIFCVILFFNMNFVSEKELKEQGGESKGIIFIYCNCNNLTTFSR